MTNNNPIMKMGLLFLIIPYATADIPITHRRMIKDFSFISLYIEASPSPRCQAGIHQRRINPPLFVADKSSIVCGG
jgi:hypothetical protein